MKEKNNHKAFRALIILGIIVVSISFCVYLFSSASFLIDEIVIKGANRVTNAEIIKRSGIRAGMSTVFFHESSAKNSLLKSPWIKEVTILKEYPSRVVISINEYEPFCIAAFEEGIYLYLSETGKKLGEINHKEGLDYPVITMDGRHDESLIGQAIQLLKLSKTSNILSWEEISEVKISNRFGIRMLTNDKRYIDFGTGNLISKWYKVEKIINRSRNINLTEKYINISSENMGIVKFKI